MLESVYPFNSGGEAYVSGWGNKMDEINSDSLQIGLLSLKSVEECQKQWTEYKNENGNMATLSKMLFEKGICNIHFFKLQSY